MAQGWPANTNAIQTVRVACPIALTAVQLPDMTIPDGMALVIKAWPTNGGLIYVGEDQSAATNPNRVFCLAASEVVTYFVKNASVIWIAATVATESVCLTAEREKV